MTTTIKIEDEAGKIITSAEIKSAKGISDERLTSMAIEAHVSWLMGLVDSSDTIIREDIAASARINAANGNIIISRGDGE